MSSSSPQKIAVIGAGISGLACAYALQKAGKAVTVYEKESVVGGRMSTREKNGYPMDTGANHLAGVYTRMRELCGELGVKFAPVAFLNYRVIKNGEPVTLLETLTPAEKIKLAILTFFAARNKTDFFDLSTSAGYDTADAAAFFKKHVGQNALDYLFDPFVSTYQFHRADELSLGAVYAMIRHQYEHKDGWALHHMPDGMIALSQALADRLDVRLGTPIREVRPAEHGVDIVTEEKTEHFDAAVLATTAPAALSLFPKATTAQKELLQHTTYACTIGVGFEIPKDLLGNITIVWVPYKENGKISGYTNEAMKGGKLKKNGKTLILAWFHEDFAKTIINKSDEEIFEIAKQELVKVCPYISNPNDLIPHDLQRWHEAMPKFSHGHLKRVSDFLDHHQGEQNVWLCGDYLNAPWTEGALRCGERVAEAILRP